MIQALLLDIEGTTSSLEFVREVLFPYARQHLGRFIEQHRGLPEVEAALEEVARLARIEQQADEDARATLERWMDQDRKVTPLKALQGLLWEAAFERGAFVAHMYADVAPALAAFRQAGARLFVYSSGSVRAQRAFFRHSARGDLTPLFEGWFDTSIGSKIEPSSYLAIASAIGLAPGAIAFFSDSQAELDAAGTAGLETIGLLRDPVSLGRHRAATSFAALPPLSGQLSGTWLEPQSPAQARAAGTPGAKAEVLALASHCHARGWAFATAGNFSVRAGADRMAITASGVDKGRLTERDVVWVTLDGKALEAGTPSAETPLHAALYRSSPNIGAVLHTHSVAATVLSRHAGPNGALRLTGYEMAKAIAPAVAGAPPDLVLPVFANQQDTRRLAQIVDAELARSPAPAYLVEGHGLTTWGVDAERARRHIEALEFLLACELESAALRGP